MNKPRKLLKSTLLLILLFGLFACSDNSTDPNENEGPEFGEVNFTVTGDLEGEKSGIADFDHLVIPPFSEEWQIHTTDISPQTFILTFSLLSTVHQLDRPGPGTYEIGFIPAAADNSNEVFFADYVDLGGDNYSVLGEGSGGSLVIEESTDEIVSGSFNCTLVELNEDGSTVIGSIQIEGEFTARQRISTN